jgi:hypothetical protein
MLEKPGEEETSYSSREGTSRRDSSHSRYIRGETIAVRTHQQHAQKQHLLETNGTAGDVNNSRDVKAGGDTSRRRYVNNSRDPTTGTPGRLTAEELHQK